MKNKALKWTILIILGLIFLGPFIVAGCIVLATFKSLRDLQ